MALFMAFLSSLSGNLLPIQLPNLLLTKQHLHNINNLLPFGCQKRHQNPPLQTNANGFLYGLLGQPIQSPLLIRNLAERHILSHNAVVTAPQDFYYDLCAALAAAQIGQAQDIRHILLVSGVDHIQLRSGQGHSLCGIQPQLMLVNISLVLPCQIQQYPYRQIR